MMRELTNLSATLRRWDWREVAILLAAAALLFGPGLWDRHRPRPWISADLTINAVAGIGVVIDDIVHARADLTGTRLMWTEGSDGTRLCVAQRADGWHGVEARTWAMRAFFGGSCAPPDHRWRVCTRFSVITGRGSHGSFGPDCSAWFDPTARL